MSLRLLGRRDSLVHNRRRTSQSSTMDSHLPVGQDLRKVDTIYVGLHRPIDDRAYSSPSPLTAPRVAIWLDTYLLPANEPFPSLTMMDTQITPLEPGATLGLFSLHMDLCS